jgi:hypothetical protein
MGHSVPEGSTWLALDLDRWRAEFGAEHEESLDIKDDLIGAYFSAVQWNLALAPAERVLELHSEILEPYHPMLRFHYLDPLAARRRLSYLLGPADRLGDTTRMFQSLARLARPTATVLGWGHPAILEAVADLELAKRGWSWCPVTHVGGEVSDTPTTVPPRVDAEVTGVCYEEMTTSMLSTDQSESTANVGPVPSDTESSRTAAPVSTHTFFDDRRTPDLEGPSRAIQDAQLASESHDDATNRRTLLEYVSQELGVDTAVFDVTRRSEVGQVPDRRLPRREEVIVDRGLPMRAVRVGHIQAAEHDIIDAGPPRGIAWTENSSVPRVKNALARRSAPVVSASQAAYFTLSTGISVGCAWQVRMTTADLALTVGVAAMLGALSVLLAVTSRAHARRRRRKNLAEMSSLLMWEQGRRSGSQGESSRQPNGTDRQLG